MVVRKIGGTTRWIPRIRRNVPAALTLAVVRLLELEQGQSELVARLPHGQPSLDHVICPLQEGLGDRQAEGLSGLEVDD